MDNLSRAVLAITKLQALGQKTKSPSAYNLRNIARLEKRAENALVKKQLELLNKPSIETAIQILKSEGKRVTKNASEYRNTSAVIRRAKNTSTSVLNTFANEEIKKRTVPREGGGHSDYATYTVKVSYDVTPEQGLEIANRLITDHQKGYDVARIILGGYVYQSNSINRSFVSQPYVQPISATVRDYRQYYFAKWADKRSVVDTVTVEFRKTVIESKRRNRTRKK